MPDAAQTSAILAWSSFLSKDAEHRFRLGLLRAEALAGRRDPDAALQGYAGLLAAPALSAAQRKFVALRAGTVALAAGDVAFRSARHPGDAARARARSHYEAAIAVVEQQGVSPDNPAHAQIVDYARNHIAMLDAGINFLGLRDNVVPVLRHQFLLTRTNDHIESARDAVQKFETYQQKADDLEAAEQQTGFELDVARTGIDTALDRQTIADSQVTRTGIQLEQIENQQGPFSFASLAGVFEWAGKMASSPDASGTSLALGTAGMIAGHIARQQELEFQHRLAEVDRDIAQREAEIAASEVEIARKRVTFLEAKIAFGNGRLDKDLFYALALVYEQLAERQVEAAIRFAYLYERAIAFFLGKPGIAHVRLDYRSGDGSLSFGLGSDGRLITAADRLRDDVLRVTDELADIAQEDVRHAFTEPPFSLAREFPVEFARFVQTAPGQEAQMDFGISFLQLSKRRPDCHQVRILKVTVRIPALAASANFAGTLTHWGRFVVRDRADTLAPATVRLVPTPDEVDAALRNQQETGTAQAAIGGVVPYALAPQAVPFGVPTDVTSEFREFTLGAFEGYGPTGRWQLELRNVNVRNLFDIALTFDLEAAADADDLETKVVPLIASYEQELADQFVDGETLDRTTVVSLRRQFRTAFEALASGVSTVTLSATLFDDEDFDGEDARVRTVIAQALDTVGAGVAGVALEISKPATSFLVNRTTGADGLSEDFGQGRPPIQPPGSRPPGAGAWQVRLPDPSQFGDLNDLVLFFLCDLRPTG